MWNSGSLESAPTSALPVHEPSWPWSKTWLWRLWKTGSRVPRAFDTRNSLERGIVVDVPPERAAVG
jgi:hypothetical protein